MTAPTASARSPRVGILVIVAAIVGALVAVTQAVIPPAVSSDVWSYPMAAGPFTVGQIVIGLHHLVLAAGFLVAWRIGLAGRSRLAAFGAVASTVTMALFAVLEVGSAAIADETLASEAAGTVSGLYGALTLLLAVASILFGIAILRAKAWTGFSRLTVLITGIYLIVPLIPAQFAPFGLRAAALAIWSLLYIGLGVGLRRGAR